MSEQIERAVTANSEAPVAWHCDVGPIICLNAYPNGITLSVHGAGLDESGGDPELLPEHFSLRIRETRDFQLPAGRYFLYKDNYAVALEKHLSAFRKNGRLAKSLFYFGTAADPFSSFQKKFEVTMCCLELLEHYRSGLTVVQTRSPMVIAALPTLKVLGDQGIVSFSFETNSESSIARYTPGQPKLAERLVACSGLRHQGIKVALNVSPILPYGDFDRDAAGFAALLAKNCDYATFGSLVFGDSGRSAQIRNLPIAQKLAADKQYRCLRPGSFIAVQQALRETAPEKLVLPALRKPKSAQLDLFAA